MKRVLIFALAAAALGAAAAPAAAQEWRGTAYDYGRDAGSIQAREDRIAERIEHGVRRGDLSRREAFELRSELARIDALAQRYRWTEGRLNGWERADLDRRLDTLGRRIMFERRDWDRRPG